MKERITFFLATIGLLAFAELPYGTEPMYSMKVMRVGKGSYHLIAIDPVDLKAIVESLQGGGRRMELGRLFYHRQQTVGVLQTLVHYLKAFHTVPLNEEGKLKLHASFARIMDGDFPFLMVSDAKVGSSRDPLKVSFAIGEGFDYGDGTPHERRLRGRVEGLAIPFLREPPRLEAVPVCYVHPSGPLACDPEVSAVLSRIERWVGAKGEVRTLTANPDADYDFTEATLYFAHAMNRYFFSRVKVPSAPPPLEGELLRQVRDIEKRYPYIPKPLLYPELQNFVVIDQLHAHVLHGERGARPRLFGKKFGTTTAKPFVDPDFNMQAEFVKIDRGDLVTQMPTLLAAGADHSHFENSSMAKTSITPIECPESILSQNEDGVQKVEIRIYRIPIWSYIQRILLDPHDPFQAIFIEKHDAYLREHGLR